MQATTAELLAELSEALTTPEISELPRYKRLYEALRQQILDGLLLPGMCLPSSRIIAQQLGLARNTVLAAIEQLCAEGYAKSHAKSGVYILATSPPTNKLITTPHQLNLSSRGQQLAEQANSVPMRGAFAPGIPDLKQFPFELWQRYVARHARNPKLDWQANPQHGGDISLRQILADYLRLTRSISCDAEQIIITNGTQQSLQLVANLLANPGDPIWMEDPGYVGARSAFTAATLQIIPQPVDSDGIAPAENAWQRSPKLIYTTPSHQYPTGVVMSASRRRNLLALAAQHQTWIIEDDYDGEFRYAGTPLAALQALAPDQVIYLGTFSKIFFPALHIGYMVLPKHVVNAFRVMQARHQREPSYITQKALADFIYDGHASAHIRKMRREYRIRRDILATLLQNKLGKLVTLGGLETGLHLAANLPSTLNDQAIAEKAYQRGIMTSALSRYTINPAATNSSGLILGFGDADQQDILHAGEALCQLIKISDTN